MFNLELQAYPSLPDLHRRQHGTEAQSSCPGSRTVHEYVFYPVYMLERQC